MAADDAGFRIDTTGQATLVLQGRWRMDRLPALTQQLRATVWPVLAAVDAQGLTALDSASALLLLRALGGHAPPPGQWHGLDPAHARTLARVAEHLVQAAPPPAPRRLRTLAQLGRSSVELGQLARGHLAMLGETVVALGEVLRHPARLRVRELTVQLSQAGLSALPVVALVTALIGVVIAYLLGLQAEKYGANLFVVDGVAIGATREFAPIIVAVIVAGRSGAAFTAQLGSMRLTEEIDAIRTLGLSPRQVLVLPRVLALVLALPLLVFVGDVASLLGAMAIAQPMLDITPTAFVTRLQEALPLRHVLVGLAKAPVFALVIAVIGVRMGLAAPRDTAALGRATTSTVVQCIVAVILLDAVFAVVLQALGW
ncbi:MlaE family ABC transporter permease [Rubrivivax albus]|uniref:ABC transporter permease n=1 Tax=Rubrivivax albus TaxID=2499835 RepID=A0A3S2U9Y3_9BURK|nr:ABC transporter permease [Rubrivivax albus]RVT52602.1 ABC transporter permease [Rubrivivax albus]